MAKRFVATRIKAIAGADIDIRSIRKFATSLCGDVLFLTTVLTTERAAPGIVQSMSIQR
jgi:hypothetical protein